MQKSWDWLVRQISDRVRISVGNLLLTGFAALILFATVWLLWPLQDSTEWTAFFVPTASATATRVVVHRKPTPTAFVPTATPQPLIHVVEEGEVLGLIAEQYDTSMEAILEANGLEDADLISIGQELIIVDTKGTPLVMEGVTHSPTPTPTPTSPFAYKAPALLGPRDSAVFHGQEARIHLQWASVAILNDNEWYEVRVWSRSQGNVYRAWAKASNWRVPASLYPEAEDNQLHWNVSVVYRDGRQRIQRSPQSQTRHFEWR